jgi:hypothetical protein
MKIIFSRKGLDKKNGGIASPIFPDGRLCSLPIPAAWDQKHPPVPRYRVRYRDLIYDSESLGPVVEELSFNRRKRKARLKGTDFCHLDPDLIRGDLVRRAGWLPMFGQSNAACTTLFKHGVREGDLFLFFGWFRRVQKANEHFTFDPEEQDAHVIFGWLQIGEIWCEFKAKSVLPKWARYHPHVRGATNDYFNLSKPVDAVFIAKRRLELPGLRIHLPGGGIFREYRRELQLTEPGKSRRVWRLPSWMYPFPDKPPLSYHPDKRRWKKSGRKVLLRTVDIGQEFILDADYYPQAHKWLAGLFRAVARCQNVS